MREELANKIDEAQQELDSLDADAIDDIESKSSTIPKHAEKYNVSKKTIRAVRKRFDSIQSDIRRKEGIELRRQYDLRKLEVQT